MRHDIRAKQNNIQYQVQIISDHTVSFILLRYLLAKHFVCVPFQKKGKGAIYNPIIKKMCLLGFLCQPNLQTINIKPSEIHNPIIKMGLLGFPSGSYANTLVQPNLHF